MKIKKCPFCGTKFKKSKDKNEHGASILNCPFCKRTYLKYSKKNTYSQYLERIKKKQDVIMYCVDKFNEIKMRLPAMPDLYDRDFLIKRIKEIREIVDKR